jgi:formate-dependent nitrite reductase membrane component NrfD
VSADHGWEGRLEHGGEPAELAPEHEPPTTSEGRETDWVADHDVRSRDIRPALGTRGGPASWRPDAPGAPVALARPRFGDSRWSFLYGARDTRYAAAEPEPGEVADANRRMRSGPVPELRGPFIKGPVWTWQVPLYMWVGGVASGAAFVAVACDAAGDERSAAIARKVALGAVAPAPLLLIGDLGRPTRFLNMLRVFKPRSPMSTGVWCLVAFSGSAAAAVGADLLGRPREARAVGVATSVLGGYLGSYAGALLACTAVPVWARSRLILGPIFVAAAAATGSAATRLTLVASGLPEDHPTGTALSAIESVALLSELTLSSLAERRLGDAGRALRRGRPGALLIAAKGLVVLGLSLRALIRNAGPRADDASSVLYLVAGLAFRYAWVTAGRASASDEAAVAAMGRGRLSLDEERGGPQLRRAESSRRNPLRLPRTRRAYGEAIRRTSLLVERVLRG